MELLRGAVSTSSSGPRLISLLLAVDRDREALARAIVDVLHEAGRLKQGKHEAISNKAAALPDKLSWSGSAGSAEGQQGTAASQTLEEPISSLELLCLAPRGKFTVGFGPTQLQVSNNKTSLQTPYAAITAVAIIDNIPKDTKGKVLVYVHLAADQAIKHGRSMLQTLVFQTVASEVVEIEGPTGALIPGPVPIVLCQMLGSMRPALRFCAPDLQSFRSSAGSTAIDAIVKVNQGHLFLLPDAICFMEKPAVLILLESVRCVELERTGGMSSSFDLTVHMKDGTSIEFRSLPKGELHAVLGYIANSRVTVKTAGSDSEPQEEVLGESDSSEDDDFDPDKSSQDSGAQANGHGSAQPEASKAEDNDAGQDGSAEDADEDDIDSDEPSEISLVSEDDLPAGSVAVEGATKRQRTA